MEIYATSLLLFSATIYPAVAEVLTQSFVIRLKEMENLIKDQKQVIADQEKIIESFKPGWEDLLTNVTDLINEQKLIINDQKTIVNDAGQENANILAEIDVYFMVAIDLDQNFAAGSTILWGEVLENVGGGYDAASGKFVAPHAGIYRFTITVMNVEVGNMAYLLLMVDDAQSCMALAAGNAAKFQTGLCRHVVHLEAGEEVWVTNPDWAATEEFQPRFTAFEGFMINVDI